MADQTTPTSTSAPTSGAQHTAGAFDIRNIIGALIGLYGLVLTVMGLVADPETAKTGGVNANLWAGIVMLVVGVAFILWARLKPIVVPVHDQAHDPAHDPADDAAGERPTGR